MSYGLVPSRTEAHQHSVVRELPVAQFVTCMHCCIVCKHLTGRYEGQFGKVIYVNSEERAKFEPCGIPNFTSMGSDIWF